MADQFFSCAETETFKMDDLLAEMRSAESCSQENTWPTKFTKKIEKQVSIYKKMAIINDQNKLFEFNRYVYNYTQWRILKIFLGEYKKY